MAKQFLTDSQIKDLKDKGWYVHPNGSYINIYSEDFSYGSVWEDICDSLGLDYETTDKITLLYFGTKIND